MCLWNDSVFLVLGGLIDLRDSSFPCCWLVQEWTCPSIVAHETEKLLRNVILLLRGDKKRCFFSFQGLIRSGKGTWKVPCHLSLTQTQDDSKSLNLAPGQDLWACLPYPLASSCSCSKQCISLLLKAVLLGSVTWNWRQSDSKACSSVTSWLDCKVSGIEC